MTRAAVTLDERYSDWLYDLIIPPRQRTRPHMAYRHLCERLYITPFRWFVPNDDNRVEDARELRTLFYEWSMETRDRDWLELDASVLEVLIALAQRVGFETDEAPGRWFHKFLDQLGLVYFTDDRWSEHALKEVDARVERFIGRTYEPNGNGGLFPLKHPQQDQRTVELWYQMAAYVLEAMG